MKGKYMISSQAKEGVDFIVLSDSIAYHLYNNYGVDFILKSRKKHVFDCCSNDENCPICLENWMNKEKFSIIDLYTELIDSSNLKNDYLKLQSNLNSSLIESFIWGLTQELSQAVVIKKRGCLSFLNC